MPVLNRRLHIDWLALLPVTYLLILSLMVLESISRTARVSIDFSFTTQIVATLLGVVALFGAIRLRDVWYRLGLPIYIVSVALLVTVLFTDPVGGASRWITIGSFQLQPSELAKVALVLVQARLLTSRSASLHRPWPVGLSVLYVGLVAGLVFVQPDLGTVVILAGSWLVQLLFSALPKRTFLLLIGLLLLSLPASYPFLAEYQRERIDTFFNPSLDTQEDGYNVLQASIAIGSGGVWGKGLDAGSQSQLNFLPAQHTDFIFAVIGEKLGFVGGLTVIIAFCVLLIRLGIKVTAAEHEYVRLVGVGVIALIGLQFVINVGMNVGIVPVTGVPLPFVSGGGTHIITELAVIGVVLGLLGQKRTLQM